jgi:hypothetical protein
MILIVRNACDPAPGPDKASKMIAKQAATARLNFIIRRFTWTVCLSSPSLRRSRSRRKMAGHEQIRRMTYYALPGKMRMW